MNKIVNKKENISEANIDLEAQMANIAEKIYLTLQEILLKTGDNSSKLFAAINYSVFSKGKCLRGFLVIYFSRLLKVEEKKAFLLAAIIELIHVFSLVHDDLPALDNDDYRRGQLSTHKKFDEATAILAGDAILVIALQLIGEHFPILVSFACKKITELIAGQSYDLEQPQTKNFKDTPSDFTLEKLEKINYLKTGSLFSLACAMPAIIMQAENSLCDNLNNNKKNSSAINETEEVTKILVDFGYNFGKLFQFIDDIEDKEDFIKPLNINVKTYLEKLSLNVYNDLRNINIIFMLNTKDPNFLLAKLVDKIILLDIIASNKPEN